MVRHPSPARGRGAGGEGPLILRAKKKRHRWGAMPLLLQEENHGVATSCLCDALLRQGLDHFSMIAVTPCPPAAQIEISPRPLSATDSSLARLATIRPPVAANGCPAANELPLTFILLRSIENPGGFCSSRHLPRPLTCTALAQQKLREFRSSRSPAGLGRCV